MNSDLADREGVIGYSASTLLCRVGPLWVPLVCVFVRRIQLTGGKEFHVAVLLRNFRSQYSQIGGHEIREMHA